MSKDYQDIWTRWVAFLESDIKIRKEVLDALHIELRQGFSVIAKMSAEQLEHLFVKEDFFHKIRADLQQTLLFSVWCGYAFYLISEEIDPVKENLIVKSETNGLGDTWLDHYQKDKCVSLLLTVDPLLSLILQNTSRSEFHQLLREDMHISYRTAFKVTSFIEWAMHQGFIFGLLEQQLLNHNKENERR